MAKGIHRNQVFGEHKNLQELLQRSFGDSPTNSLAVVSHEIMRNRALIATLIAEESRLKNSCFYPN